ncbi:hypothetical protein ACFFJY_06260 [Fictibacillus aquaticus]|jgi:hypothetical protein|uniref:Uncharacterized protein n=1 Tax=Fictibacillus aquaticus TaxID=2021314 RepID=A0A235FA98_9BACL|nr:hypothetical protein [Fictibacillus aquaticus]OYD58192.1 hypothetical protein CGZ90_09945 [Fictibacillus aquaticus]
MQNNVLLKLLLLSYLLYIGRSVFVFSPDSTAFIFTSCWMILALLFAAGQFSVQAKRQKAAKAVSRHTELQQRLRENSGG